jgi:uncharacterized protein (TIGR02300 family)
VSKAEWGTKRVCPNCGKLYYDMKKNPPVCPACKTPFDPENLMRSRRGRADKKVQKAVVEEIEDIPVAVADDAVIEDAEELADDAVDEVVEVENEEA